MHGPDDVGQLGRKCRAPGRYHAFVPDELGTALPVLGEAAKSAAKDAVTVLARADERIGSRGACLNHLLIQSESISSSWIKGNRISPKRLAIAEALCEGTRVTLDVIGNVRATEAAIADASRTAGPTEATSLARAALAPSGRQPRAESSYRGRSSRRR
jgi:hypothetical protein